MKRVNTMFTQRHRETQTDKQTRRLNDSRNGVGV